MSRQTDAIPTVLAKLLRVDPNCGVMLQGSASRGQERADSDLDITVVIAAEGPLALNDLVTEQNQWAMRRIREPISGIDLDINWVRVADLKALWHARGAAAWYMFATGKILHDALGVAQECQVICRQWFDAHPSLRSAWEQQSREAQRAKADDRHVLQFPTQPAFLKYLQSMPCEEDG